MYINELTNCQGLFGEIANCHLENIILDSAIVIGREYVGSLCGMANNVEIIKCSASDSIFGMSYVGGLIGSIENGFINNCYTSCLSLKKVDSQNRVNNEE